MSDKVDGRISGLVTSLRWAVLWGAVFGLCFSVLVGILLVVQGSEALHRYHTTLLSLLALYFLGGIGAGIVLGLFRPLVKWLWGAAIVGVIATIPIAVGARIVEFGVRPWNSENTVVTGIYCVTCGTALGWIYWGMFRGQQSQQQRS